MPVWTGLALVLAVATVLWWLTAWFIRASPRDLAHGARAALAAFSALAGTGLLLTGRVGLAVALLGAAIMAARAMRARRRGADPLDEGGAAASTIETSLLSMRLDSGTGAVDGEVRTGAMHGRRLAELGLPDLLALLGTAGREDPPSIPLLEAYLDRRYPHWRGEKDADKVGAASPERAGMDAATARSILGVGAEADREEIKQAHRRLMEKLHPDHGGSDFLAAQINRARETLLSTARR